LSIQEAEFKNIIDIEKYIIAVAEKDVNQIELYERKKIVAEYIKSKLNCSDSKKYVKLELFGIEK